MEINFQIDNLQTPEITSQENLKKIANLLLKQVRKRFSTNGASGGSVWPGTFRTALGVSSRLPFGGIRGDRVKSFVTRTANNEAEVVSTDPFAFVDQLGTIGAGGVLPDIVAKRAKALFIPLTEKAARSVQVSGLDAAYTRWKGGEHMDDKNTKMIRAGIRRTQQGTTKHMFTEYLPLIKGRLKNGKLEKWDAFSGTWKPGKPDFIFLKRVTRPPRPMLPDSPGEQLVQETLINRLI